ncbi:alpha/beta-hydrolase [Hyaloscypha variabilis F]|uniref:Alpha/beta-hydrolase n=1 Tax=Hyaloscypha variabilis (strain UAMH 11265 / GT02V1 / F) TaxID=1149755 RepID=A0A2J6QTS7_HYAVF|nr:alpha/beta-hydrolase [Hyaloscypha variabilis F]
MASTKTVAPYGTWTSPITTDVVAGSNLNFAEVHTDPKSGAIYLIEGRPSEKGRHAIVQFKGNETTDILPPQYNANGKIHAYGGGAAAVSPDGNIIFTDSNTDGVFSLDPFSSEVTEIIKGDSKLRFGNFCSHPIDLDTILAVQEDHRGEEVINTVVVIDKKTKEARVVVHGADFYSHPKFSPDGKKISWVQWIHPDMPWTGSELYVADWKDGSVKDKKNIAGQARVESIVQPKWLFDGSLMFVSDRTGFWQLYRYEGESFKVEELVIEGFQNADLGAREIVLGFSMNIPLNKEEIIITYTKEATNGILLYNIPKKSTKELPLGLVSIFGPAISRVSDTQFAVIGGTRTTPDGLYLVDITKPSEKKLLKSCSGVEVSPAYLSAAQTISFPRTHGNDLNSLAHAIFIPPRNGDFEPPSGSIPPLIISIHGGPSSHVNPGLTLDAQYYTSRGYAYCYVNYAGSTGYGRKYRDALNYYWGIKDAEDTVSCIEYLASKHLIDGTKVGITGGSAGGYTVLNGMCMFPKVFAAGNSLFGVSNLKTLASDTHKFESHYLFDLIFPDTATEEEREKVYYERSPCLHANKIERPLLLLQGDKDKVVPLNQAEEMERVLKAKGADVKLVVFEGEGHGFAMEGNIKRAIEEEEALWRRTLL